MHLIVGATGSLGGQIAELLLRRGEHVRVMVRADSPARGQGRHTDPARLAALGAEVVGGDLNRPETLPSALAGVTYVLSTASATKRPPPDSLQSVDVDGTTALARAAVAAGVRHFVYVSTVGAEPTAPSPLFRDKGRAEQAARAIGVPLTVLHPVKFMQDWIGFLIGAQLQATATAGRPRVQLVGDGDVSTSFVDEADVARLAAAVLGSPDTVGETIPLAAEAATYRDVVARWARALRTEIEVETVPWGGAVDTVPEALAGTITGLLAMAAASPADSLTTPEVAERFGLELNGIDGFLRASLPT